MKVQLKGKVVGYCVSGEEAIVEVEAVGKVSDLKKDVNLLDYYYLIPKPQQPQEKGDCKTCHWIGMFCTKDFCPYLKKDQPPKVSPSEANPKGSVEWGNGWC